MMTFINSYKNSALLLINNYSSGPNIEGERNNCLSKTQLVGQKYRDKTTLATVVKARL